MMHRAILALVAGTPFAFAVPLNGAAAQQCPKTCTASLNAQLVGQWSAAGNPNKTTNGTAETDCDGCTGCSMEIAVIYSGIDQACVFWQDGTRVCVDAGPMSSTFTITNSCNGSDPGATAGDAGGGGGTVDLNCVCDI